jgi:membrane-associated protease RseP (regulator of RpoE activity)
VTPARWDDAAGTYVTERVAPPHVGSRPWVHLLLLGLTFLTTTWAGASFYANYITAIGTRPLPPNYPVLPLLIGGMWFSIPALLILGCHEMGHYIACRYYRIPATLPYFLPVPTLVGTFGAVIRMAVPRTKNALFDVGIAGPIAGFVVLVPVAIFGVSQSFIVQLPPNFSLAGGLYLGDPYLLTGLQRLFHGPIPAGHDFVMHPAGFAAWFGLLATAFNLFPAGQLDGGHIVHALVGRWSRYVTLVTLAILIVLGLVVSSSWIVWSLLLTVMTVSFGLDHPPVEDEHRPIGRERVYLAIFAVVMFALSFTPVPISPIDFVGGR